MSEMYILETVEAINGEIYELGEATGKIKITGDDRGKRVSDEDYARYEERLNMLSPKLAQLYRFAGVPTRPGDGALEFAWRVSRSTPSANGREEITGTLRMPTLSFVFDQDYWAGPGKAEGPIYTINQFCPESWVVMRGGSRTMWVHHPGIAAEMWNTGLSFDEWFEIGCQVRFLDGWEMACVDDLSAPIVREELEYLRGSLFPKMQVERVPFTTCTRVPGRPDSL